MKGDSWIPRPYGSPWITINGQWHDNEGQENLHQVLCSKYLRDVPECN